MTFWETMLTAMEDQMIEAGVPGAVAHQRAVKALLVITTEHHGERVEVTRRPYVVRADIDAEIHELVQTHGVEGTAGKQHCTERTIQNAISRHRRARFPKAG